MFRASENEQFPKVMCRLRFGLLKREDRKCTEINGAKLE